jgi:8-oxo-dGTP pyrophosphatase MutT (NUDIX family)
MSEVNPAIPAATVVLVRDTSDGIETLMLRRNAQIAFGGMWVFPGGRIDPEDGDGDAGARNAAAREANEEAGLVVDPDSLVPYSHWTPPEVAPKRFATWFFLAVAPDGEVAIDGGEIHDHVWVSPAGALSRHAAGEIELAPPTFVTLTRLAGVTNVDDALRDAREGEVEYFLTRIARRDDGVLVAVWHGDVAYDGGDLNDDGARHRLHMVEGGWRYERYGDSIP